MEVFRFSVVRSESFAFVRWQLSGFRMILPSFYCTADGVPRRKAYPVGQEAEQTEHREAGADDRQTQRAMECIVEVSDERAIVWSGKGVLVYQINGQTGGRQAVDRAVPEVQPGESHKQTGRTEDDIGGQIEYQAERSLKAEALTDEDECGAEQADNEKGQEIDCGAEAGQETAVQAQIACEHIQANEGQGGVAP